jgi:hypothetical protein
MVEDGNADDIAAGIKKLSYLADRRLDIAGIGRGHRLDGNRETAAN